MGEHNTFPGRPGWTDIAAKCLRTATQVTCLCGECLRREIARIESEREAVQHSPTAVIVSMSEAEFAEWEAFKGAKQ